MDEEDGKRFLVWRIIGLVLVMAQVTVSVLLVLSIIRMNVLVWWIVLLIGVGLMLLLAFSVVPLCFSKKRLIVLRILGMIISIACVTGGLFAFQYTNAFNGFLDKVSQVVEEDTTVVEEEKHELDVTKDPFIIYISGSDSHYDVNDPEARSDVNIVVVVNPKQGKMLLASIPRDTYVQLHGTEGLMDKLTHAGLGIYYDANMSELTLEDYLGINIDYTIKVSFDTVVGVVDELGGIEIYSDKAMKLSMSLKDGSKRVCNYVVGKQYVDGVCALRFARERKSYARGDKHRGENQQEVLTGIINKFLSSNDYLLRLPEILGIVADSFKTSFPRKSITDFLQFQLAKHVNWQIESIGLDGVGDLLPTYTYPDRNLWVMLADEDSLQEVKDTINQYLVDGYSETELLNDN